MDDPNRTPAASIAAAFRKLPLLGEDLYLQMQATNLEVVDELLVGIERQVLDEYMETDRLPLPTAVIASALSQLWIFGVYELLRTWRQRTRDVVRFAEEVQKLGDAGRKERLGDQKKKVDSLSADPDRSDPAHFQAYELAATDEGFLSELQTAFDRSEGIFRQIEALRVHLAKHEMPRAKGSFGMTPGYGRIDMTTGSIYWQVFTRNKEVQVISRRDVAAGCSALGEDSPLRVLPKPVQAEIVHLPEESYGVKRVTLTMDDGSEYEALVGWNKQVLGVIGFESIPFNLEKVVRASGLKST